jgi:hypothetical protein
MQRFGLRKKVKDPKKESYGGFRLVLSFTGTFQICLICWSLFRGGGKCPEEEHTTCSGGPTIVIVTSAVYGERHYFIS